MKTIVIILALLLAWIGIAAVSGASQAAGQINMSKFEEIQLKVPANLTAEQANVSGAFGEIWLKIPTNTNDDLWTWGGSPTENYYYYYPYYYYPYTYYYSY